MTVYANVTDDWFVRKEIIKEVDEKILSIADYLLTNEIDYEEDAEGLTDAITCFIDDPAELTHNELEYVLHHVQIITALQHLIQLGIVEATSDNTVRLKQ